eukprot:7383536-Prymnesium_polylepis.1
MPSSLAAKLAGLPLLPDSEDVLRAQECAWKAEPVECGRGLLLGLVEVQHLSQARLPLIFGDGLRAALVRNNGGSTFRSTHLHEAPPMISAWQGLCPPPPTHCWQNHAAAKPTSGAMRQGAPEVVC